MLFIVMKPLYTLMFSGLALFATTAVSPLPAETAPSSLTSATQPSNLTEGEVLALLDAIVIEDFDISKANISKAIDHLDTVMAPHGVQILFEQNGDKDPIVNLKTRNLSLTNNLSYLCKQGDYAWRVQNGVIVVGAPGAGEQLFTEIFYVKSPTVRRLATAGER